MTLRSMLARLRATPLGPALRATAQRFPLPLLASVALTVLLLVLEHRPDLRGSVPYTRATVGVGLSFLWLVAARLLAEARGWDGVRGVLPAVAGVAAIAARLTFEPVTAFDNVLLAGGLALLVLTVPALGREAGNALVWTASYRLGASLILAGVAAGLLAVGVCLILVALRHLLGVPVPNALYADVSLVCGALLLPALALAGLPRRPGTADAEAPSRVIILIGTWILTPVALAYLVTLLAYAVKIAVQGELPRGQVTWIASLFSAAGVVTWLTVWPLRDRGPAHVRLFHRILYPALAVPAVLLLLAVAIRVNAYGVTEDRYVAALFGAWVAAMSAGFTVGRARRSIAWAPGVLGMALCLASFGPWGARPVSVASQTDQLAALLEAKGRMRDGRIVTSDAPIDERTVREIRQRLRYLIDRNAGERIAGWLPDGGSARMTHADIDRVLAAIGTRTVVPDPAARRVQIVTPYAPRWFSGDLNHAPSIDLAGYEHAVPVAFTGNEAVAVRSVDSGYRVELRRSDGVLSVSTASGERVHFDLARLATQAVADAGVTAGTLRLSPEKAAPLQAVAMGSNGLRVRMIIQEMDVAPLSTTGTVRTVQALLLVGGGR